jgi:hypothetical protein
VSLQALEFVPCSILSTSWKDVQATIKDRAGKSTAVDILRQFQSSAKTLRLNSLVAGIDNGEALEAARTADIELVSGTAVLPVAQTPFVQRPFTAGELGSIAAGRAASG